jgi:hypothetical protein
MRTTVPTGPTTFGEALADADETLVNPEYLRTRANITVAQAIEIEEREAVRRSVDAQYPAVAAFLEESGRPSEFLERMHALHESALEGASPAVVTWVTELEEYVRESPDPRAAFESVSEAVADAIRSRAKCKAYAWCVRRGEHDDHHGASITVTAPGAEAPYLDASLIAFEPGSEFVGFAEADLTPAQARQEAAKLRAFAGHLEGLAAYVDGGR